MSKRKKEIIIILLALAILIIPFVGVSLLVKGDGFLKSLSRIAGDGEHFVHLFIFGNLIILFILVSVYYLCNFYKLGNKRTNILFIIACVLLEITVLTPYIPEKNFFISQVHNYCAYSSILLLVFTLFRLIFTIPTISRRVFVSTSIGFVTVVGICLIIFLATGRPSGFFELTLITLSVDLILLTIVMLHFNEKNKINGTLEVKYKIINKRSFKIQSYEAHYDVKHATPIILHDINSHWKNIEPRVKINPFRKVFVYFDKDDNKYYIGVLTKKKNNHKDCIVISNNKWAIFNLDDTFYTTKEHAWNFINETFINENNYYIDDSIYLEKYVVTKNGNIRKSQIWIPIIEKNKKH